PRAPYHVATSNAGSVGLLISASKVGSGAVVSAATASVMRAPARLASVKEEGTKASTATQTTPNINIKITGLRGFTRAPPFGSFFSVFRKSSRSFNMLVGVRVRQVQPHALDALCLAHIPQHDIVAHTPNRPDCTAATPLPASAF